MKIQCCVTLCVLLEFKSRDTSTNFPTPCQTTSNNLNGFFPPEVFRLELAREEQIQRQEIAKQLNATPHTPAVRQELTPAGTPHTAPGSGSIPADSKIRG
jgi:hypothetical protein